MSFLEAMQQRYSTKNITHQKNKGRRHQVIKRNSKIKSFFYK